MLFSFWRSTFLGEEPRAPLRLRSLLRRQVLTTGDPSAAISLAPRTRAEAIGRSLRLALGVSLQERMPTEVRSLLGRL